MIYVTGAIIIQNKKVLIARRAPNEKFAGFWEFPGGKIENNETHESCLRRELNEEFNIEVRVSNLFYENIYEYSNMTVHLFFYLANIINGEIMLNVHDKIIWAARSDLLTYTFLPADISVAKKIVEVLL